VYVLVYIVSIIAYNIMAGSSFIMETSNKFKSSSNWLQPPAMISSEVRTAMSNNEITSTSNLRLPPTPRISSAVSDEIRPDLSPVHGGSLLTVQHAWPARRCSLDGETLRSRSDSFVSTANTVFRSRAGSTARSEAESGEYDDVSLSMALTPEPRHKQDFQVTDNRFAFSPGQLNKLLNPKSLAAFRMLGGLDGLASGLRTDLAAGLSMDERRLDGYVTFEQATGMAVERKPEDDSEFQKQEASATAAGNDTPFADRLRIFGRNQLPDRQRKGFLGLLWDAYNDKIMILLTVAAVISLSLGMYEALSGGSRVDWIEGVAICVTILLVTVVMAANDWQKERQFAQLSKHVSTDFLSSFSRLREWIN
jgi:Ca2+-transporting ATPase